MKGQWKGHWLGGRFYLDADRRPVYVIEKMRQGIRPMIALRMGEEEAKAELSAFFRDPPGFVAKHRAKPEEARQASVGVMLTKAAAQEFIDELRTKKRDREYVNGTAKYLADWSSKIQGRDLRSIRTGELEDWLKSWTTAHHLRIAAIKGFYKRLVRRQTIKPDENPAAHLGGKKSGARKLEEDVAYSIEEIEQTYGAIDDQRVRDVICIRAKTGMHHSEIVRVASGQAQGEIHEVDGKGTAIVGFFRFVHKSGMEHRVAVDAQVMAAMRRIAALPAGKMPTSRGVMPCAMKRAAKALAQKTGTKVEPIHPSALRHSFVTWGIECGEVISIVRDKGIAAMHRFTGHIDGTMIRKFYFDGCPPMASIPIKLFHPDDPPLPKVGSGKRLKLVRDSA